MKIDYTDEEIVNRLTDIFNPEYTDKWGTHRAHDYEFKIEINRSTPDQLLIKIQAMYEKPGLKFSQIMELAEYFDTKNIETESEFGYDGCETCDYGSQHGFYLLVRDGEPFNA